MKPRKAKELLPDVAAELKLPMRLVEAVALEYWKEVWLALTNLKSSQVHVNGLGDFKIKNWQLEKEIKKYEDWQVRNEGSKHPSVPKMQEKLRLLKEVKKKILEEQQRKEFINQHKNLKHEPIEIPDLPENSVE